MNLPRLLLPVLIIAGSLSAGLGVAGRTGSPVVGMAQAAGGRALPPVLFTTAAGGSVALAVEVADEGGEARCGLMYRTEMPADQGMLFVFDYDWDGGFWMRNTLIPLAIAYLAADGRIVDILEMRPVPGPGMTPFRLPDGTEVAVRDGDRPPDGAVAVTYSPRGTYRYAIEANRGWFAAHDIGIGDYVDLSAALAGTDAAAPPPVGPC